MGRIHEADRIVRTLGVLDNVKGFEELFLGFPVGLAGHQPGLLMHV